MGVNEEILIYQQHMGPMCGISMGFTLFCQTPNISLPHVLKPYHWAWPLFFNVCRSVWWKLYYCSAYTYPDPSDMLTSTSQGQGGGTGSNLRLAVPIKGMQETNVGLPMFFTPHLSFPIGSKVVHLSHVRQLYIVAGQWSPHMTWAKRDELSHSSNTLFGCSFIMQTWSHKVS